MPPRSGMEVVHERRFGERWVSLRWLGAARARFAGSPAARAVPARAEEAPAVAAAASLRYALDEIAERFEKETGQSVRITYGATGNLVHQIENGAPFQVLLAADDEERQEARRRGPHRRRADHLCPRAAQPRRAEGLAGDGRWRAQGARARRSPAARSSTSPSPIPDVAPYGRAAREALAEGGPVGASSSRASSSARTSARRRSSPPPARPRRASSPSRWRISAEMAPKITAALVPESWHEPIDHGMALIKGAGPTARAFADFVQRARGRARVLESNGFSRAGVTRGQSAMDWTAFSLSLKLASGRAC